VKVLISYRKNLQKSSIGGVIPGLSISAPKDMAIGARVKQNIVPNKSRMIGNRLIGSSDQGISACMPNLRKKAKMISGKSFRQMTN